MAAFTDLQLLQLIPIWNVLSDLIYYKYDKKGVYPTTTATTANTPHTHTHTHADSAVLTYVYTYMREISCINHNIVPIISALVISHLRTLSPVLVNVAVIKRFFDKVSLVTSVICHIYLLYMCS